MDWLMGQGRGFADRRRCTCRSCRRRSCSTCSPARRKAGTRRPGGNWAGPRRRGLETELAISAMSGAGLGARAGASERRARHGLGPCGRGDGRRGRGGERARLDGDPRHALASGPGRSSRMASSGRMRPPPSLLPPDPGIHFKTAPPGADMPGANTTIAAVATDAALDRSEALRVALMAQDGLARAIRPAHCPLDGDTVFALSTGPRAARRSGLRARRDRASRGRLSRARHRSGGLRGRKPRRHPRLARSRPAERPGLRPSAPAQRRAGGARVGGWGRRRTGAGAGGGRYSRTTSVDRPLRHRSRHRRRAAARRPAASSVATRSSPAALPSARIRSPSGSTTRSARRRLRRRGCPRPDSPEPDDKRRRDRYHPQHEHHRERAHQQTQPPAPAAARAALPLHPRKASAASPWTTPDLDDDMPPDRGRPAPIAQNW